MDTLTPLNAQHIIIIKNDLREIRMRSVGIKVLQLWSRCYCNHGSIGVAIVVYEAIFG